MSSLPFHLLELNLISAQEIAPVSRNLRTYAVTWVHAERKLRTRVDHQGHTNPTWNDKFVFRVDDKFLNSETSAVMIEIYAVGWLRDIPIGSVRVLVGNLIPPFVRKKKSDSSRRFVALQIRRPSGRPQGILNVGVTLLDNTMRSMPLYTELSTSAVGYQDLMDDKNHKHVHKKTAQAQEHEIKKSDEKRENGSGKNDDNKKSNSKTLWRSQSDRTSLNNVGFSTKAPKESSIRNGSVCKGSILNGSIVNGSIVNGSFCSDIGPSPSLVAAAMAKGLYPTPMAALDKPGSSILEDWTVEADSSVEGLKSKIDRWRMELPPIYDRDNHKVKRTPRKHSRRHTADGGRSRLFSCFGNAYGCEFTIVCGGNDDRKSRVRCGSEVDFTPSELGL